MSTCDLFFSLRSDALAALLGLAVAGAAPSPFLEGGASLVSLPAWSLDSFEGRPFLRFCSERQEPTQRHHNWVQHTASSKACNRDSLLFKRSSRCNCSRRVRRTSQKLPGLDILSRATKVRQHLCALPSLLRSPRSYTVEEWNKGMLVHCLATPTPAHFWRGAASWVMHAETSNQELCPVVDSPMASLRCRRHQRNGQEHLCRVSHKAAPFQKEPTLSVCVGTMQRCFSHSPMRTAFARLPVQSPATLTVAYSRNQLSNNGPHRKWCMGTSDWT